MFPDSSGVFNFLVSHCRERHKILGIDMVTILGIDMVTPLPSPLHPQSLRIHRGSFLPDGRGGSLTQQMLGKGHSVEHGALSS